MNPQEFGSFGGKNQYRLVKSLNYSFSIIFKKTIPVNWNAQSTWHNGKGEISSWKCMDAKPLTVTLKSC